MACAVVKSYEHATMPSHDMACMKVSEFSCLVGEVAQACLSYLYEDLDGVSVLSRGGGCRALNFNVLSESFSLRGKSASQDSWLLI